MKIAYLINQYPQPSQSFIRREIAALEAQGVQIARFTVRQWDGTLVDEADLAEQRRTRVVLHAGAFSLLAAALKTFVSHPRKFTRAAAIAWRLGKKGARGRLAHLVYLAEACLLCKWFAQDGIEHVHAHFGTNSATVAMLCRALGGPAYSFTVHGPEEFDQPIALALGEKVNRSAFAVTISEFGRSQLYRCCALADWPKIHIVRCGLDESFLQPARQISAFSPSPGTPGEGWGGGQHDLRPADSPASKNVSPLPNPPLFEPEPQSRRPECQGREKERQKKRLLCVGRLAEQKGQLVLIDAADKLRQGGIDFDIFLVGDGPMRGEVERRIAQLKLGDKIRLAGWLSNDRVRQEMLASCALVLPSFAEGLPVVLMEALALGCPAVSTQVAGVPELIDSQCGILVPPGDAEALAEALARILHADEAELASKAIEGAKRVLRLHDASQEAGKLQQLFASSTGIAASEPNERGAVVISATSFPQ